MQKPHCHTQFSQWVLGPASGAPPPEAQSWHAGVRDGPGWVLCPPVGLIPSKLGCLLAPYHGQHGPQSLCPDLSPTSFIAVLPLNVSAPATMTSLHFYKLTSSMWPILGLFTSCSHLRHGCPLVILRSLPKGQLLRALRQSWLQKYPSSLHYSLSLSLITTWQESTDLPSDSPTRMHLPGGQGLYFV